MFLTKWTST